MDEETFYTIPEAAAKLRVKRDAIYKWMREGRLSFVIVGSQRRITGSAITTFVREGTATERADDDKMDTQSIRLSQVAAVKHADLAEAY